MATPALMQNYGDRTLTLVRGEGNYVWDDAGQRYLDAIAGIAVCGLGHCHPAVTEALHDQARTLLHVSNLYNIPAQEQLADRLVYLSGMDNVFFSNSGAEANEAAIKLARRLGNERGYAVPKIVVMEGAFHGRTLATLTATGNEKVQQGFAPLPEGFLRAPFDDPDAINQLAAEHPDIVAVLVEPVQGEGGIRVPAHDYLNRLRNLCDKHDWLLMLDEIQTGNGRSGKLFAYQHNDILPDVVTTAKGLGNGVPIGACLARGKAARLFTAGSHGSTFGGNPLACRAALAVLDTLENQWLIERAEKLGARLLQQLRQQLAGCDAVVDIRGLGLLVGVALDRPCGEIVEMARAEGILINVTAGNVVRLLPPLTLTDDECARIAETVSTLIQRFTRSAA
ncbi:aspartate aminotransferase family protein [Microbulbifer thermotolerans]|uniref:Acetylornithine aminotransferase n=2 Tax=Microbulbifer thermotolerans TaxID=252514 RepID=A0AB35I0T1_MICTH|nr:aspartate aminotransferase family protein [Microbulbifer thermotolerans]MCX2778921.1 aspartate aminotransferase family protein [Microbulbifer thermotolerans]MCX2781447.1 aspartate aminotransferase family protein [Microbulbifer thermotolerans]MCX2793807.1 aspartate aminotransferase family protein [Microbulbifer thermotolerans]MCX2802367.1 aspartate aminotransferase family protein [Microbulbifer thermotolerans]MCX2804226.1 aspartate aminotransferase family protein [Microbulbifer thermotoleran